MNPNLLRRTPISIPRAPSSLQSLRSVTHSQTQCLDDQSYPIFPISTSRTRIHASYNGLLEMSHTRTFPLPLFPRDRLLYSCHMASALFYFRRCNSALSFISLNFVFHFLPHPLIIHHPLDPDPHLSLIFSLAFFLFSHNASATITAPSLIVVVVILIRKPWSLWWFFILHFISILGVDTCCSPCFVSFALDSYIRCCLVLLSLSLSLSRIHEESIALPVSERILAIKLKACDSSQWLPFSFDMGTWCSWLSHPLSISSAPAGGAGFNSQCVQTFFDRLGGPGGFSPRVDSFIIPCVQHPTSSCPDSRCQRIDDLHSIQDTVLYYQTLTIATSNFRLGMLTKSVFLY